MPLLQLNPLLCPFQRLFTQVIGVGISVLSAIGIIPRTKACPQVLYFALRAGVLKWSLSEHWCSEYSKGLTLVISLEVQLTEDKYN
nr:hypothetical transcript [Hymenolepis microstoma]